MNEKERGGLGVRELAKRILEEREDRAYGKRLNQKRVSYGAWAAEMEKGREAREGKASPGFVVFCAGKGRLSAGGLGIIGEYFAAHPEVRLLYGDEDVWEPGREGETGERKLPWYKPDWSPELFDSFFYLGSAVALRRDFLEGTHMPWEGFCGGKEEGSAGDAVYEVADFPAYEEAVHAWVEAAGGYDRGAASVGHVEGILFHASSGEEQEKFLREFPWRKGREEEVAGDFRRRLEEWRGAEGQSRPFLSIVIPSKDHPEELAACLEGCLLAAGPSAPALPFEVIVVDNGSSGENRERIAQMARQMEEKLQEGCGAVYLYRPMEFNFSGMCNLGAAQARGELLLFLNDDVELCRAGAFERMAALAVREGVGAVGMKLYYPDSRRIQHAGITNLPMGPVHKLQFQEDDRGYYYGANRGNRNVLAVTAACLMVGREKYREAGGFPEEMKVAFNDVELCFRLYEAGFRNVCMNGIHAFHHESLSRGDDESLEGVDRLEREREMLYARHPGLEGEDPYYPHGLNRRGLDTGIRPAYLTARNQVQRIRKPQKPLRPASDAGYSRDDCLMVRVEDCRGRGISGYGVVLGDDNACYDRKLLLREEAGQGGRTYALDLEEIYRPDLEENMPDQRNVALCGFDVEIGEGAVPPGRYRVGMAVRSRVAGVRLLNWSNRCVHLSSV